MTDLWKPLLALAISGIAIIYMLSGGQIKRAPGVLAAELPQQAQTKAVAWRYGKFTIQPQASYDITARVLSVERYRMDAGANIAPLDFAVGWGKMSDSAILQHFRLAQSSRFFTLYPDEAALNIREALLSAANMHLVPANKRVESVLRRARSGNIAHLTGYLIDVRGDNGFAWNTSLTREDNGDGACELMWVEAAELK